ncbi:MAG: hypothetical protein KHX56_01780 [Clostridiales bacterium]|nr:hypothetical protein [Clostridiales bacterium]
MLSIQKLLHAWIFMICVVLLTVRFLHTTCYNKVLTDDFVPDEKYTDYLENDRMEDVDVEKLYNRYARALIEMPYFSESIILDRDIYYYTEPDVHSEIMYTLKAGETYYFYGSKLEPTLLSFATYDRGWRYALPLPDEQQYQSVTQYRQMTTDEREGISEVPYTDQEFGYIQLKDLVYITRKFMFDSGYFTFWEKVQMLYDDRYGLGFLYGEDEFFWREGMYISPDLYLPYWRRTEKLLLVLILLSAAGYGMGPVKRKRNYHIRNGK